LLPDKEVQEDMAMKDAAAIRYYVTSSSTLSQLTAQASRSNEDEQAIHY
jgi:hypothetical protein